MGVWAVGLGFTGMSVLIYMYDAYYTDGLDFESWKKEILKKDKIDRLKINKTLSFGTRTKSCASHSLGIIRCNDLQCFYGPLSYFLNAVDSAHKSIKICIFNFSAQIVLDAILEAKARGVKIRCIGDVTSSYVANSMVNQLRKSEVPVRQRMTKCLMHHKFILIDDEVLFNGSLNLSMTAFLGQWECDIVSSHPQIVQPFVEEFEALWEDFAPGKSHDSTSSLDARLSLKNTFRALN